MTATTTRNIARTAIAKAAAPRGRVIESMRDLGYAIGNADRMTLESTQQAHKNYAKASDEVKKTSRTDFIIGFVAGTLHATYDVAATILKKPRTERSQAQVRAVQAAMQKFNYHIARKGTKHTAPTKPLRLTSRDEAQLTAGMEAMGYGEITRSTVDSAIAYLKALRAKLPAERKSAK